MKFRLPPFLLLLAFLAVPTLAHAHTGHGSTSGFSHGMGHPLTGLDHICAMIAVGIWAAQMGRRSVWAVPLSFVSIMAIGGGLGMAGIPVPFVEQGIVASVLILGVMIAAAVRLPLAASCAIVGLFAICHGFAHGAEMPETSSGLAYGAGFMIATAALHLIGVALGVAIRQFANASVVRYAGGAIAACGVYLGVMSLL